MCTYFSRIKKLAYSLINLFVPDFCRDFEYTFCFSKSLLLSELHATYNFPSLFTPKNVSWRERNPPAGVRSSKKFHFHIFGPKTHLCAKFQLPNSCKPWEINSPSLFSPKSGSWREGNTPSGVRWLKSDVIFKSGTLILPYPEIFIEKWLFVWDICSKNLTIKHYWKKNKK